jgi:hypothetical protein
MVLGFMERQDLRVDALILSYVNDGGIYRWVDRTGLSAGFEC